MQDCSMELKRMHYSLGIILIVMAVSVVVATGQQSHPSRDIDWSQSVQDNVVMDQDLSVGGDLAVTGALVLQNAGQGVVSTLSDGSLTTVQMHNQGQSFGSDMINNEMASLGLWEAHDAGGCASNEGFIPLFVGSSRGFCIEKNERSPKQWISARMDCLSTGKRLPEAGEWLVACTLATDVGITLMTGNHEWSSNFPLYVPFYSSGAIHYGYYVPLLGSKGCNFASWGWLAHKSNGGSAGSHAYRCVH